MRNCRKHTFRILTFNSVLASKIPDDAGFFAEESMGFAVTIDDVSVIP